MFCSWFLKPLRFLVRWSMYSLMEDVLLRAFGFPNPPWPMRGTTVASLKLRAGALRLLPKRKLPFLRTQMKHRSHPNGYAIEHLGPNVSARSPETP
ncbi:MAG TPA: hypothetical protein VIL86_08995 [Tepidisphaeraceae bacterium]|jgi:hypothetical protein